MQSARDAQGERDAVREHGVALAGEDAGHGVSGVGEEHGAVAFYDL